MRVNRENRNDKDKNIAGSIFLRKHGNTVNLSSALRDRILPHLYVFVDVEDGMLILEPTDNQEGYKLVVSESGQAKMTYKKAAKFLELPDKTRIYGFASSDGKIVLRA